jgi:hypothetical protein
MISRVTLLQYAGKAVFCLFLYFYCLSAFGQNSNNYFLKRDSIFKFAQPFLLVQSYGLYTMGERADLNNDGQTEAIGNRFNLFFRRARVGFRGEPYQNLRYTLVLFYDNLGKDDFTGTRGTNNGEARVGVFEAFGQWRLTQKSDLFHLSFGFFRPQISRESITSAWNVNSLEKAISQNYTRQFTIGRSTGRTMGLNLGGLYHKNNFGVNYNIGMFTNEFTSKDPATVNTSAGTVWSPVWVGRTALTFGQPEMKNYGILYFIDYFNERNGLTIAPVASYQGKTDVFDKSYSFGGDMLLNYKNLNLDGEVLQMYRHRGSQSYSFLTTHIRAGYNIVIARKYIIEPVAMLAYYKGDTHASEVKFLDGEDVVWDVGLNWYLDRNFLKIVLHYVSQDGYGANNLYTRQNSRKAEKGDYVGIGFLVNI